MNKENYIVCKGSAEAGQSHHNYLRQGASFINKGDAVKFVTEDVQGLIDFYKTYGYPTKKQPLEYNLYEDGILLHTLCFRMDGKAIL